MCFPVSAPKTFTAILRLGVLPQAQAEPGFHPPLLTGIPSTSFDGHASSAFAVHLHFLLKQLAKGHAAGGGAEEPQSGCTPPLPPQVSGFPQRNNGGKESPPSNLSLHSLWSHRSDQRWRKDTGVHALVTYMAGGERPGRGGLGRAATGGRDGGFAGTGWGVCTSTVHMYLPWKQHWASW